MTLLRAGGVAALLAALAAAPVWAQAARAPITCGEPYVVRPGDTLQRIAVRAYGPDASWRDLIEPNRAVLRGDPSLIEIGQVLAVPCRTPAPAAATAEPASPPAAAPSPTPADPPPVAAARGADPLPVAPAVAAPTVAAPLLVPPRPLPLGVLTVRLPFAGRAGAVLAVALERAGLPPPDTTSGGIGAIDVVAALRTRGGPALAAPMPRPDCDAPPGTSAGLCSSLAWSAPLAEVVISTFTRADRGPVTRDTALRGRRLCTTAAVPRHHLEARRLTPPDVGLELADSAARCFTLLRAGTVEAAIMPAAEADAALPDLPQGAPLTEQFALAQLMTLHAVALAGEPEARAALDRLDTALAAMAADGSWFALAGGGD